MFLKELKMKSFRSYEGVSFNLNASRILIAGVNGSGKSSVAEAIQWLILNRCGVTDGRGSGVEYLQPSGSAAVNVAAVFDQIGSVERIRQRGILGFAVEGIVGEPTVQQSALLFKLNSSQPYLEAVLNTDHFLRLHHAESKDLVLSLLNVRIPYEGQQMTLDQIETRYQTAFAERKTAKLLARNTPAPTPIPHQEFPAQSAIEAQLEKLRGDLQARMVGVGQSEGKRQALQARLTRLSAFPVHEDIDMLAQEFAAAENRIAAIKSDAPAVPPVDMKDVAAKLAWLTSRREALDAHVPSKGCVIDQNVECPQKKMEFTKRRRDIDTEISALPPVNTAPKGRSPLEQAKADAKAVQVRLDKAVGLAQQQREQLAECEALTAEINSLEALSPEQAADIETLKGRITKGETLLKDARRYQEAQERYEAAVANKQKLEDRVVNLERLCDLLGPNGIRLTELGNAITVFTDKINAFTKTFGWTVEFLLEPWSVVINKRPIQTYSESEQFRIGIAIQLAVAELSGLSFAVIDRLDMLDLANRNLATKMIMASPVGQVIILATREPNQAMPKSTADLLAYRVENLAGKSVIAEAAAA